MSFISSQNIYSNNNNNPRVMLVDDDIMFSKIMIQTAKNIGVDMTTCASVSDFAASIKTFPVDVVILDYDLGNYSPATGVELAEYLERSLKGCPTILISRTDRAAFKKSHLPINIKSIMLKDVGPNTIINAAVNIWKESSAQSF